MAGCQKPSQNAASSLRLGLYHAKGIVWVSPSRDYVPMRYSEIRRGVTCLDVQLSYAQDGEHGWVPAFWKAW